MALVVVVPMGAAGVVAELDGDVLDAGFPCILDAVGVGVIPDEVAEGGELIEACVPGDVIFPGGEGGGAVVPVVVLASESTVSSPPAILGAEDIAGRGGEL